MRFWIATSSAFSDGNFIQLWLKAVLYLSSILWGVGREAGAVRTSKTRHSAHHVWGFCLCIRNFILLLLPPLLLKKQINKNKKLPVLPDDSYGTGMVVHWSYAVLHALIYCGCLLSSEGSVINVEQLVCGLLLFTSGLLTDSWLLPAEVELS